MQLPELAEGWSWRTGRRSVPCTNSKCCGPDSAGHPKVFIELLLHDDVRRHGTIDVEFYGAAHAIRERAGAMVKSVQDEQLRAIGLT